MSRALRIGVLVVALLAVVALVMFDLDDPYGLWVGLVVGAAPLILVAWFFLARTVDERLRSRALVPAGRTTRSAMPSSGARRPGSSRSSTPRSGVVAAGSAGSASRRPDRSRWRRRAFTPIDRDGKPVAGLVHDRRLLRRPRRLQAAVDAASLALDNERLKAQLRAELREVQASRSRSSTPATASSSGWSATFTTARSNDWSALP